MCVCVCVCARTFMRAACVRVPVCVYSSYPALLCQLSAQLSSLCQTLCGTAPDSTPAEGGRGGGGGGSPTQYTSTVGNI